MRRRRPPAEGPDPHVLAQVREAFGRVVYTHKAHEKQADILHTRHRLQQGALVVLTAVSSGTFLFSIIGVLAAPEVASLVTSFVALLVSALSLTGRTFRFAEGSAAHSRVASSLWDVRESYISLIADMMSGSIGNVAARARRDELQHATFEANSGTPRTSAAAFRKASAGLREREEMTFTAGEIDLFLPVALRLTAAPR